MSAAGSAPIVGILLAAGFSRRFGTDKLRRLLPGGETVAQRSCQNLLAGVDRVLAVVRPGADELVEKLTEAGAEIVVCSKAERGMGASLACGVRASPAAAHGWVIALADMPWIEVETIRAVAGTVRQNPDIVAPVYQGRRGHPVGFSRPYREALSALDGDEGAKSIIRANAHRLRLIEANDPGVLQDIDLPADFALMRETA